MLSSFLNVLFNSKKYRRPRVIFKCLFKCSRFNFGALTFASGHPNTFPIVVRTTKADINNCSQTVLKIKHGIHLNEHQIHPNFLSLKSICRHVDLYMITTIPQFKSEIRSQESSNNLIKYF